MEEIEEKNTVETPEKDIAKPEQVVSEGSSTEENAVDEGKAASTHMKKKLDGIKIEPIANKLKSMGKKQKLLLAAVLILVVAGIAYFATKPPYVGKWYSEYDDEPFMEVKRDGTAVLNDRPEASITWKELENGDIKFSVLDFSDGEADQSTFSMEYGKTNNGMEYLSDMSGTVLFKSADDFKRIEESSKRTDLDELSNKDKDSEDEDEDDYDW